MLPTPKPTTASVQQRGPNGRFISTSVAPGETNNATNTAKWSYQTFLGIKALTDSSTLMITSLNNISDDIGTLVNLTSMMETTLENMLALAQDSEVRRAQDEEKAQDAKPVENGSGIVDSITKKVEEIGIASAVLGLFTIITSLSKDLEKTVRESITTYLAVMSNYTKNMVRGWVENIKNIFKPLEEDEISKWGDFVESFVARFSGIIGRFQRVANELLHNPIFEMFSRSFETIFELVGKITKIVFRIMDVVLVPAIAIVERFGAAGLKMFGFLTKWIGRIFWPLQILLSAIDFIGGFIDGYEKSGVMEGIREGLTAVFDGLVTGFVDMVKNIVGWVLDKLGAHAMAASWREGVDKIMGDLSKAFQSIIDIFMGLATLNPKMIWDGLKTGFDSLKDLFLHIVDGAINLVLSFFDDILGTSLTKDFDKLKENFIKDVVDDVKNFLHFLKDWIVDSFTSIKNFVTGQHTDEDVEKKAAEHARQRSMDDATKNGQRVRNVAGNGVAPVVTDADRAWAASQYGDIKPSAVMPTPAAASQAAALAAASSPVTNINNTQNNQTNTTVVNAGGNAPAIVKMGGQYKASAAHPLQRAN